MEHNRTYRKFKNRNRIHASGYMLREGGFSLVETIVALGLLALVAAGLVQLNFTFRSNVGSTSLGVRANALAAETVEAVRALRDENWSNLDGLTPRADYYLSFSEGLKKWSAVSLNPGKVEAVFTRSFRVFPVYRDSAGGNIVSSGGVLDAETLRVEVIVSWIDRGTLKDQRLISYLSNF